MKNEKPAALPHDASAPARTKRVSSINVVLCLPDDYPEAAKRLLLQRLRAEAPLGIKVSG